MQDYSRTPQRRRKKQQSNIALFLILLLFPTMCASAFGFVLYRAGYIHTRFSSDLTATVVAQRNASCRALIEKAMQASNTFCSTIDSNTACYGNNTIQAELAPGTTQKFSTRGDIVDVDKVRRLSASPLKLDSNEWGVAVLKVIANLPRSLPGETVTMIVFGNTTLDKQDGNLESFFFSSELGQIVCEKVPDDGIMISVPDGEGIKFMVNGAELTLTGDATMKATKNGKMEISLFEGSGRIVSDGQEQYFGAGQQVSVPLGGENGNESVGPPSTPTFLSQSDLDTACSLTGQFCSPDQITHVTSEQAQQSIQAELGITPTKTTTNSPVPSPTITRTPTQTPTFTRTSTTTATRTSIFFITRTPTRTPTRTRTSIPVNTSTKTRTPTKTPTRTATKTSTSTITPGGPTLTPSQTPTSTATRTATFTPTVTSTSSATSTPTATFTNTATSTVTNTPTQTPTNTATATQTSTPTNTFTPTNTATMTSTSIPTATNTPIGGPGCSGSEMVAGSLTDSGDTLFLDLTNNSGGNATIDAVHIDWLVGTATQIKDLKLDGDPFGNPNDTISPSDFPSPNPFNGPVSHRVIDNDGTPTETLAIRFQNPPTGSGYTVQLHFDIGCQITASK